MSEPEPLPTRCSTCGEKFTDVCYLCDEEYDPDHATCPSCYPTSKCATTHDEGCATMVCSDVDLGELE